MDTQGDKHEPYKDKFRCIYHAPDLIPIERLLVDCYGYASYGRDVKNGTFDVSALLRIMDTYAMPDDYQAMILEVMGEFEHEIVSPLST